MTRRAILVLLAAASSSACSGFGGAADVAPGDMTSANALETAAGVADWSCLGGPPAATPSVMTAGNVRYSVLLRSLLGAPLDNVVARVCQTADLSCATPLGTFREGLTAESLLGVDVPLGFSGFLEIEAAGASTSPTACPA